MSPCSSARAARSLLARLSYLFRRRDALQRLASPSSSGAISPDSRFTRLSLRHTLASPDSPGSFTDFHQESSRKLPRRPAFVPLISGPPISRREAAARVVLSGSGQHKEVTTPNRSSNPISNTCIASVAICRRNVSCCPSAESGGNHRLVMPKTPFADTNVGGPLSTDRCICHRQICRTALRHGTALAHRDRSREFGPHRRVSRCPTHALRAGRRSVSVRRRFSIRMTFGQLSFGSFSSSFYDSGRFST